MSDTEKQPPRAKKSVTAVSPMQALERLSLVLQLQRRARQASAEELPFVLVNETRQLLPYRQAVFFALRRGRPVLEGVSGLAVPEPNSPYAQWITRFAKWRLGRAGAGEVGRVDFAALAAEAEKPPAWLAEWREWLPRHGLWAPLFDGRGGLRGVLAVFREDGFNDSEASLFAHLSESYAQTWALANSGRARPRASFLWYAVPLVLLAAACFLPLRQSALAPAEVSARRPALVRAGIDGVIDRFLVEPNQAVEKGQPLIRLEDAQIRTRLAVAKKAEDMAEVEYRQLLQAGLSDPRTKQRIPLALGRMEQLAAETAYVESLMERVVIASPMRGVVICDNPDEWLGRPVSLGQRIMLVADPADVELEISLPADEALRVEIGDELLFFPNIMPDSPVRARISYVGYRAGETPGVGMAFTLRAELDGSDAPLLGLRGMAKLYGPEQPLGLALLRKPILAARQWLGL